MSILEALGVAVHEPDPFDSDYGSPAPRRFANHHESAATAHPGDVALDDEQDERMSLQSRRDAEEARLVKAHPALTFIKVLHEMDSCWLNGKRWDAGERWNVFVSIGDFMGSGVHASDEAKAGDAAVANLKGKMDSAAVSRAKLLDNSASVALTAEGQAA